MEIGCSKVPSFYIVLWSIDISRRSGCVFVISTNKQQSEKKLMGQSKEI